MGGYEINVTQDQKATRVGKTNHEPPFQHQQHRSGQAHGCRAAHLRYLHAELEAEIASHGGELTSPYKEPKEDYQGWSEWQLWNLMAAMGPKMGIACPLLFETDIQFKVNVEVV